MIEWKQVPGWPHYSVSDTGQVWSELSKRYLSRNLCTNGYYKITLYKPKKQIYIHDLVMLTFVGPKPRGLETRHKNDLKYDNKLVNLCYGTRQDNMHDMLANGNNFNYNKTECNNGHEYLDETTYIYPDGRRECRICSNTYKQNYVKRKRAMSGE